MLHNIFKNQDAVPYIPLDMSRRILVILFFILAIWYLSWRPGTFNHDAMFFSVALYAAELYGLFVAVLHIFMVSRLTRREPLPVIEGRTVDVFIPTINEPVDLLRKTIIAARNMDYEHDTWLLDDGNRPEMKQLAEDYGIRYLARDTNEDAKAGNLNHALAQSDAEFICIFDADHCPQQNFIVNTIGYFADNNVAFVQTPQDFYNLDSFQHRQDRDGKGLWTEQSLFFRVIQRGKDYWNAAFFCGSCAIVRRSALDSIGGFATGTLTEDLHTSIRLHKKGYRSIYMQQSMAYGIAPSNVAPFLNQRVRWGQGAMQVWKKEGFLTCRGLTPAQRLNYLASALTYFDGWQKGLFYLAPAIVLFTGVMPITAINSEFLIRFIPYYLLNYFVFEELGRGYGKTLYIEQYNFARFAAFAYATLALFGANNKFAVTDKTLTPVEVNRRVLIPQKVVSIINLLAIPLGISLYYFYDYLPVEGVVANVIWASLNFGFAFSLFRFTSGINRFKRSNYRFPISLPAQIKQGEKIIYATVDNISSSGCKFYGAMPETLETGSELEGIIMLPSGELPFNGRVAAKITATLEDGSEYIKGIGCQFIWRTPHQQDQLDLFLYGSGLQWRLHDLSEQSLTPLQWILKIFRKQKIMQSVHPEFWVTTSYYYKDRGNDRISLGLIAGKPGGDGMYVIAFTALEKNRPIVFQPHSRTVQPALLKCVEPVEMLESPSATLFIYELVDTNEQQARGSDTNARTI